MALADTSYRLYVPLSRFSYNGYQALYTEGVVNSQLNFSRNIGPNYGSQDCENSMLCTQKSYFGIIKARIF